jgi:RNA polymerase sigma-70 factor (ECF subfamily)
MAWSKELSESDLLRRTSAGDEEAFRAIYQQCQGPIYRFALYMSGSASIAEDVTQEVFLMLIQGGICFDPSRGTLLAYLCGMGRNLLRRRLEKERMFVPFPDDDWHNGAEPRKNGHCTSLAVPPADPARSEMVERVRRAILTLPLNYREVVLLCELQDMSYEQASGVLGCAVGTVRSRLHRARAMLMEKLRDFRDAEVRSAAGGQA